MNLLTVAHSEGLAYTANVPNAVETTEVGETYAVLDLVCIKNLHLRQTSVAHIAIGRIGTETAARDKLVTRQTLYLQFIYFVSSVGREVANFFADFVLVLCVVILARVYLFAVEGEDVDSSVQGYLRDHVVSVLVAPSTPNGCLMGIEC